ncbi:hypothetical protein A0H81_09877 [Grifola frondosa]|uniref:Uncharacterized protein n=1 Tax=Grifola frondosa TaxID=5627 RepID=A0A1C7M196_GRIFR|nr:hypothetical protein A0H81_09877 [Grifola frondosa]
MALGRTSRTSRTPSAQFYAWRLHRGPHFLHYRALRYHTVQRLFLHHQTSSLEPQNMHRSSLKRASLFAPHTKHPEC